MQKILKSYPRAVFYTLISAISLSLVGLFAKLSSSFLTVSSLVFWRFAVGSFLAFPLFYILFKQSYEISKNYKSHIVRAVFVLGAQYSFFYYLSKDTLLDATLLLNTGPLFIPLIERTLFGQKIGKSTVIGSIICFIGVICILQPGEGLISTLSLVGLLSGFCQGMSQVLFGKNSEKENPLYTVLVLFSLCTFLSFFPFIFDNSKIITETQTSAIKMILFLLLLGVFSLVNQLFRGLAYKDGKPSSLAPFLYFTVVMAGIFDWLFFAIIPNFLSIIGGILVIFGAILKIYLRSKTLKK